MAESKIVAGIDFSQWDSMYWSPEPGETYEVVVANWRTEPNKHKKDNNDPDNVLTFDLVRVDGEEYQIGDKVFKTSAKSFMQSFKPILVKHLAKHPDSKSIGLHLSYSREKKYNLIPFGASW